jgi:hypothetical protein
MTISDQSRIDKLYRELKGENQEPEASSNGHHPHVPPAKNDEEVVDKILAEKGGKFKRLWQGDTSGHDHDHSSADDAFIHKVWSYTQDEEQVKRIHAMSGLHRPEKSGRRADYLQRSINRARKNVTWFYDWQSEQATIGGKAKPVGKVRSRSHSLGSTGVSNNEIDDLKQSIQALSFTGRGKPGPREWVVDNILWKGHASSWFGEGGVAKSLLALHLALTVAAVCRNYWMGFAVKTMPVLYVDFELDADEQHRRASEIATGMGLSEIPEDFYYLSVAMMPPYEAFGIVAEECRRLGIGLVIVDSVGFALDGDSEKASDVLCFYRTCIQPLKDAGASPLLIDHQAKVIKGEKYSDKQAFGSIYKTNAVRSAFQIRGSHDQGEITATFTHKKNNFGWKEKDFSLKVLFEEGSLTVERLVEAEPNPDIEPSAKEKVLKAVEELGRATAETVRDETDMKLTTVRNAIASLLKDDELIDTGDKQGRSRIVVTHSQSTKVTGTGTKQKTPASFLAQEGEGVTDLAVLKERQEQAEDDVGEV